ncbi:MAG: hypothetical protein ACOC44_14950 [Promethearchaeia archaeon]
MFTIKFCPECGNLLMPKKKKLYCKTCDKSFEFKNDELEEYKIKKKIKHDEDIAPVVFKKDMRSSKISLEDRKAYEEYFKSGQ